MSMRFYLLVLMVMFLCADFSPAYSSEPECAKHIIDWPCYRCIFLAHDGSRLFADELGSLWQITVASESLDASRFSLISGSPISLYVNGDDITLVSSIGGLRTELIDRSAFIEVWDLRNNNRLAGWFLNAQTNRFQDIRYDATSATVLGNSWRSGIGRWSLDGKLLTTFPIEFKNEGVFSPHGQIFINLVVKDADHILEIWDLTTGQKRTEFVVAPVTPPDFPDIDPYGLSISQDNALIGINHVASDTFEVRTLDGEILLPE